jgi:hypothetical protein
MEEGMSLLYAIVGIIVMALAVGAIIAGPRILELQNNAGNAVNRDKSSSNYKAALTNCIHKCNPEGLCARIHAENFENSMYYVCSCVTC